MNNAKYLALAQANCQSIIVCALACEAKSLIELTKAQHISSHEAAKLYYSDTQSLAILLSGVGAKAVPSAVQWAKTTLPKLEAWLNVGVAGHKNLALGSMRVIHSVKASAIENQSSKHSSHPHIHFRSVNGEKLSFASVQSVNEPSSDYPDDSLIDMEAAVFIGAVRKFASLEAIQLIKVVSDNQDNHHQSLTAKKVTELIAQHSALIIAFNKKLIEALMPHLQQAAVHQKIGVLSDQLHITESQKQQLLKLLPLSLNYFESLSLSKFDTSKKLINNLSDFVKNQSPIEGIYKGVTTKIDESICTLDNTEV